MARSIRRVLVHGSNGVQGGAIARRLSEEGFDVRAGVRDLARAAGLGEHALEAVEADLESSSALLAATEGMDAVVLTLPLEWNSDTVLRWMTNVLDAARRCHVGLVVFNSSTRIPVEPSDVSSFEIRRAAEALLWQSGLPAISLRPPLFMENLRSPAIVAGIAQQRTVAYPIPDRLRISWLAMRDLGGYVGAALRRPDLAGETLEIGGPDALDGPALASALSDAVGARLQYTAIPPDAFERALASQFPAAIARGIAQTYYFCARYADTPLLSGSDGVLTAALSRPRLGVREWARSQAWHS